MHSFQHRRALAISALGILFCLTPWATPGLALGLGLVFALTLDNPYRSRGSRYIRGLLQASVVLGVAFVALQYARIGLELVRRGLLRIAQHRHYARSAQEDQES